MSFKAMSWSFVDTYTHITPYVWCLLYILLQAITIHTNCSRSCINKAKTASEDWKENFRYKDIIYFKFNQWTYLYVLCPSHHVDHVFSYHEENLGELLKKYIQVPFILSEVENMQSGGTSSFSVSYFFFCTSSYLLAILQNDWMMFIIFSFECEWVFSTMFTLW